MVNIYDLSQIGSKFTVLYAEDDPEIRVNIQEILENIFFKVFTVSNGIEGIDISKKNHIDIIISDIKMPLCDGFEMIKTIKESFPQIITIMITGYDKNDYLKESIKLSINKYLIKPIKKEDLFQTLKDALYLLKSQEKIKEEQLDLSKNIKMIAISRLLENLSHQWRQSLSIINSSLELVSLDKDLKIGDQEIQKILNNASLHITKMDDILNSLFQTQENKNTIEYINLNDITNDAIAKFKVKIDYYNIKFAINIENEISLYSKLTSLQHIFYNLLENSIDLIDTKQIKNSTISINFYLKNDNVIFEFIDTLGGIHKSIKDEIFEPYTTTKHNYIGTGLGLYIVYILTTKSLKGTIDAQNITTGNNLEGAKFTISIPQKNHLFKRSQNE